MYNATDVNAYHKSKELMLSVDTLKNYLHPFESYDLAPSSSQVRLAQKIFNSACSALFQLVDYKNEVSKDVRPHLMCNILAVGNKISDFKRQIQTLKHLRY